MAISKRKKIIIIVSSVLAAAALAVGGFFLVQQLTREQDPIFTMSDEDFLTHFGTWQKDSAPALRWTFSEDGKGKITTNDGADIYDMTWALTGNQLTITTAWLYDMTNEFSFTTDRENQTFTIVDVAEDKITTFIPVEGVEETAPELEAATE